MMMSCVSSLAFGRGTPKNSDPAPLSKAPRSPAGKETETGAEKTVLEAQRKIYSGGFYLSKRWRWIFRDDCRYRRRRLAEVLDEIGYDPRERRVFDVGFGTGDLLFTFPESCTLMGVELSPEAVEAMLGEPRVKRYAGRWFEVVPENGETPLPPRPVDAVITSHVLEHVPDDRAFLDRLASALKPGGLMINFVPVETAGFDPKHIRTYTSESLADLMASAGLELVHAESNYHICCGPLKWLDHPARHNWSALSWLEGLRHVILSPIPYRVTRLVERMLAAMGVAPNQALVIGRKTGSR
ncbi:MAG: class I SAM-dependent methyltransferase [Myxococcales bacterium]|nr:MAG: class I SAM-dependent methyltransferase [Myxococcales bacterium]